MTGLRPGRWTRGNVTPRSRVLGGVVTAAAVVAGAILTAAGGAPVDAQTVVPTSTTLASSTTVPADTAYTVSLSGVPALATSATVAFDVQSTERATQFSVCPGSIATAECTAHPVLTVPVEHQVHGDANLELAGAGDQVTLYSSASAVKVNLRLTRYTVPTWAATTPSPTTVAPTSGPGASASPSETTGPTSPAPTTPSATTPAITPSVAPPTSSSPTSSSTSSSAPAPSSPAAPASPSSTPTTSTTDKAHWVPPMVTGLSGFPGPSNTGVPQGTALTVFNGDMVVTTPGAHIDRMEIRGYVTIKAPGVVISNSRIIGLASALQTSKGLVQVSGSVPTASVTVVDSELYAQVPSPNVNGVMGKNMTLTRVNIHDVIDSVHITGDNVTVTDSWLHNNLYYVADPSWGGQPSHNDSVQIQSGSGIALQHNTIQGANNAAIMVTQDTGPVSMTVERNFIDNGACSINLAQKTYGPIQGTTIANNTFGGNTWWSKCGILSPPTTTPLLTLGGNVWLNGTPVAVSRGS